ncbi:MAG: hypothetical protein HQK56_19895, partial [Deltaproteobacteria bacterium]|nr:hypothetical protein [Deltaproteobacteria bacterium]
LIVILLTVQAISLTKLRVYYKQTEDIQRTIPLPPENFLKLIRLEFSGLLSDIIFIQAQETLGNRKTKEITPETAGQVMSLIERTVAIDPYFLDPYYLSQAFVWYSRGPDEIRRINQLLISGAGYRTLDPDLLFYAGFNYYFFLKEYRQAGDLFSQAAKIPGGWTGLAGLAAKMYQKGRDTASGIVLLKSMLLRTTDKEIRKYLEIRLDQYQKMYYLESAVKVYQERFMIPPRHIEELVAADIIPSIPVLPKGQKFYLDIQGNVDIEKEAAPKSKSIDK